MLALPFISKFDWYFYMVLIAETTFKKFGALIHSIDFLSVEVVLYLFKSAISRA